jgi:hypothetical protein
MPVFPAVFHVFTEQFLANLVLANSAHAAYYDHAFVAFYILLNRVNFLGASDEMCGWTGCGGNYCYFRFLPVFILDLGVLLSLSSMQSTISLMLSSYMSVNCAICQPKPAVKHLGDRTVTR